MSEKVIPMPTSGYRKIYYSLNFEYALRDFIISSGENFSDSEFSDGIASLYFMLDNEIPVEQKIHIRMWDYICYTSIPCNIRPNQKENILNCIRLANKINCELDYGNFEVDERTGKVVFKSIYEPDDFIFSMSLDKLIFHPRYIVKKYRYEFLDACKDL